MLVRGEPLALGGAKQRALLAILLIHANEVVSTDRLVDLLWGDTPPATAAHTVQVYVSNLRKVVGADRLVTRAPGYAITVASDELDLGRFERALEDGCRALGNGDPTTAARILREALSIWRGPALADFTYEAFAQVAIARLEELRLVAIEERVEADLALGRHAELVPELHALVGEHPLRERPRAQLMLALYRSGRQADALELFQSTRRLLVEELGIEPSPPLAALERAILQQDPALDERAPARPAPTPDRSLLVAAESDEALDGLVSFAEPLASTPHEHELVLALAVTRGSALAQASKALNERRAALDRRGVAARAAAFTSSDPGTDLVRLASEQDVDLVLLDGAAALEDGAFMGAALTLLTEAPCDVALLFARTVPEGPVFVPFGGAEHDWGALELAAWCARALGRSLLLLGTAGAEGAGRRDASRLLAHAALAVQQLAGVVTESELAAPGHDAILEAAARASLIVVGLADDWAERGLGSTRAGLVERASTPVVAVRKGLRPGGLAPGETLTRFTWSLSGAYALVGEAVPEGA